VNNLKPVILPIRLSQPPKDATDLSFLPF